MFRALKWAAQRLRRPRRRPSFLNRRPYETWLSGDALEPRILLAIADVSAIEDTPFQYDVASHFGTPPSGEFTYAAEQIAPASTYPELKVLASGLESPVQVIELDDGSNRLLIVERTGQIRIVQRGVVTDQVPPTLSNIDVSATHSDAVVTWTSDENVVGYVEFGIDANLGSTTALSSIPATYHRNALRNLEPDTQYHYRVIARDSEGNTTVSPVFSFTTASVPTPSICLSASISRDLW